MNEKWIVISFWDHRTESGYSIEEFYSEEKALDYSKSIDEEDLYCVAKIVSQ
ncbi:hypothetical protein IFU39_00420 [Paenibacillus sp. CFBP 13594]|uniref:hypothetical protein n=1 Tax=Paenibacillus sp. CFBP 13594 TaxID=2774037 RepID=UPI001782E425|nr:hypothetical protein [Paenibacillus sp. CFBP 13594]MBD8836283.1 hypothetical protein [Paenibacillus sp. CFBP 13594]